MKEREKLTGHRHQPIVWLVHRKVGELHIPTIQRRVCAAKCENAAWDVGLGSGAVKEEPHFRTVELAGSGERSPERCGSSIGELGNAKAHVPSHVPASEVGRRVEG